MSLSVQSSRNYYNQFTSFSRSFCWINLFLWYVTVDSLLSFPRPLPILGHDPQARPRKSKAWFHFMASEQGLVRKKKASAEMEDWTYRLAKVDLINELRALSIDSRYVDQRPDEFCAAAAPSPDLDLRPATVISQMRKWGLHFDGKNPWTFLERIEVLRGEYEYPEELLLRGLPEVLRGNAFLWYQNAHGWRD